MRAPRCHQSTLEEIYLDIVVPFRAWRYSPQAGELASLVAPPYDVIGPDLQAALYARSPHNVVHLDLGLTAPGDGDSENQYTRAGELANSWKQSGVLVRDAVPTVTFVEEHFTGPDGQAGRRHGVLAAMRLTEFGDGVVFPHERTLTGPKEDRFRLMTTTAMSLSPVFMLYDLPGDELTAAWRRALGSQPATSTTTDEAGNITRLWRTADPKLLALLTTQLSDSRFLIADGHHRYETALRYQQAMQTAGALQGVSVAASDYCLVYLANKCDPALAIYPTHRLLRGLSDKAILDLPLSLSGAFTVERLAEQRSGAVGTTSSARGADAQTAITKYLSSHPRSAFGLWGRLLDSPYGVCLSDPANAHVSPEYSDAYQELDVAILQTLVLERTLGISAADIAAEKNVTFFKDTSDAFARLESGEFQAGFFMNPAGLDQVCEVAFGGERMPQKTTFFYPKLPTGLVFHDLAGSL